MLFLMVAAIAPAAARAELRGAWIASVHNINWPSKPGLSAAQQRAELAGLLDAARKAGLNAVLLQVRPESDALYASKLEPWSRYLTGEQGASPGYDPLAFAMAEASKRGLAVHAWLNPYRANANVSKPLDARHIAKRMPQYTRRVGTVLWMDPGAPEVRDQVVEVVRDLLSRYELAGIHFDDYFYPYPDTRGNLPAFDDGRLYESYR
ncbi:MAG: family 10 glycosylhydrolase, partial [Terrimicrobiaceae bacterium]|nr:family 10 glycosylhydrolase [Terrimicrobiaceae bacterium]